MCTRDEIMVVLALWYLGTPDMGLAGGSSRLAAQTPPSPPASAYRESESSGTGRTVRFETTEGTWMNVDVSPDGRTLVFDLLGDLYTLPITGGTATRLTSGLAFDTEPVFSPDGRTIAFVSDRSGSDNLWLMDADGRHVRAFTHETTTPLSGPEWLSGGEFLLVARKPDGYWLYRADGTATPLSARLAALPARARLGAAYAAWARNGRVLYTTDAFDLRRIDLAEDRAEVLSQLELPGFRPAVSPDGRWVIFGMQQDQKTGLRLFDVQTQAERWLVYPLPDRDLSALGEAQAALPRYAFTPDGRALILATGGSFQRLDLRTGRQRSLRFRAVVEQALLAPAEPAVMLTTDTESVRLRRAVQRDEVTPLGSPRPRPESAASVALEGATVITMRGEEVLRDATVLVTGSRIVGVGPRGAVALPPGVHRLDVRGTTILPGLIDVRGGALPLTRDSLAGMNVPLAAYLAAGVTTVRALPVGDQALEGALQAAAYAERLDAGTMTGARWLMAGAVTARHARELTSAEVARALVQRQRQLGAIALVQQGPLVRQQRQWLAAAAREAGLPFIGESGTLRHALTLVADGYHTVEGAIPNARLYADVRHLLAASRTVYVPTLLAATGGRGTAEEYFWATTDVRHDDPLVERFGLRGSPGVFRRVDDDHFLAVSREATRLAALGTRVGVGTRGQVSGLGMHWELWALALGGVAPHVALRAATAGAAEALGLGRELGTIEVGKRADLVVLDGNPLRDVRQSRALRYVMRDGVLFEPVTLRQLWPRATSPLPLRQTGYDAPPLLSPSAPIASPPAARLSVPSRPRISVASGGRSLAPTASRAADSLPIAQRRTVAFETTEGTNMSVDLSPDGRTLVFDLLGDLYTMPVEGGGAIQLTRGASLDRKPVWSPDGKQIAYVSDASGTENLWVVAADGANPRPVAHNRQPVPYETGGDMLAFTGVEWAPDGQHLISGDTLYDLAGGKRPLAGLPPGGQTPRFSPNGQYLYVNRDGVRRVDRTTGQTIQLARPPVHLLNPIVSPDGRWLTYVAVASNTDARGLRVRDLETGDDRWLAYPVETVNERYVITPDSRAVILGYGGKLHRIDLRTGADVLIPFAASVNVELGAFVYHRFRVTNDSVTVRAIRTPAVSPDGKTLVFEALRRLYIMPLPAGMPRPLISHAGEAGQFHPAYSPDGRWIAYVTWSDTAGGHVWRVPAVGGRPERLTTVAGYYERPAWSPDGQTLAVLKLGPKHTLAPLHGDPGTLQLLPSDGGPARSVAELVVGGYTALTFTANGQRLLFYELDDEVGTLVSVGRDGRDRRVIARTPANQYAGRITIAPSPDGRYAAYTFAEDLFLAPLPKNSEPILLQHSIGAGPLVRLKPGLDPRWDPDSKALTWISGPEVYRLDPERAVAAAPTNSGFPGHPPAVGAAPPLYAPDLVVTIRLQAPRQVARGTLALRGARVVTMRGDEVLENATLVVADDRITAMGPASTVVIPRGAKVLDVRGKTIIPGLVDLHAHFMGARDEALVRQAWQLPLNLAYGVTTSREVAGVEQSLGIAELIETGRLLGPRLFAVGNPPRPPQRRLETLEDARAVVQHLKRMGAVVIKQYEQPTARQRQWVIRAADEAGLNVTGHNDADMLRGGGTGMEHYEFSNDYEDRASLLAAAKTWVTPTIVWQKSDLYDETKWHRLAPPRALGSSNSRFGRWRPGDTYEHIRALAGSLVKIVQRGGRVTLGSHGDYAGIGAHWELWAFQLGGFTPLEALRAGTLHGAEGLGMQQDLGSIEVGKIADLLVLDKNPLEDIRHTLAIRYVMKNGILYDDETLDTLWPGKRAGPRPTWMSQDSLEPDRPQHQRRAVGSPSPARP